MSWRAFDLVAALHTSRVTGITARLLDASGTLVPSAAYLRSTQLADGEELELVAKLAGDGTPATLELTGTRNGAAWQQKVALGTVTNSDAGFLPRQWAQHHIAARMLAKHEPVVVPPCVAPAPDAGPRPNRGATAITVTPVVCKTEVELRQARDEEIRQDIVTLGKQYFLLSRHTSLIVLENDAMYAKYGVRKGGGDTWAQYAMPAKIPVVTSQAVGPIPDSVADDAELIRTPLQIFYDQNQGYGGDFDDRINDGTTFGSIGTIGHGAGTGQGFGIGAGRGGGGLASRRERAPTVGETTRASLGLAARASSDPRAAATESEAQPTRTTMSKSGADRDWESNERSEAKKARPDVMNKRQSISTADVLGNAGPRRITSRSRGGKGRYNSVHYGVGPLAPMHFHYPTDAAFDDLSGLIPALVPDAADEWRSMLVDAAGGATSFPMDDAAKQLLASARAKLPSGIYRWGDLEIAVDRDRRLGWRRTTELGLAETASYDGSAWTRRYAELGLSATRTVKEDDVALALAYLPIWIAEPAHYARYFVVTSRGPREIGLSIKDQGKDVLAYVMRFDDSLRLVSIRDAENVELLVVTWDPSGPTAARVVGGTVSVGFSADTIADASQWAHGASQPGISVELPSRIPEYWRTKAKAETAGSPVWRHAQRQLLVSAAALQDRALLASTYDELRTNGGVELGDVVLASGGIATTMTDKQAADALGPFAKEPVARYLIAARKYMRSANKIALDPESRTGALGALWTVRAATARFAHSDGKAAIELLMSLGDRAYTLRLVGAASAGRQYNLDAKETVRAWESVASGEFKNVARAQAAQALYNRGNYDGAAEQVMKLAAELDLTALPPRLDIARYTFQYSRRGPAGWQIAFSTWRDRVLAGTSYEHVMAVLPLATYRPGETAALLARASELAGADVDRKLAVARAALQYNQQTFAREILEPMLKAKPTREMLILASSMASTRGNPTESFEYLERAQDAGADEAVDINTVRSEMRTLLSSAQQAALQSSGAARAKIVERAVVWGKRWRAIDPGNDEIDRNLGTLLLAVGDGPAAWRQLSSIIERDPWAGSGYATVADQLEQQGKIVEALEVWQQAVVIDQTNPTHRLRKAQALIALGKTAEGDALLEQIVATKWHDMWTGTVYQAKNLIERGKQQK